MHQQAQVAASVHDLTTAHEAAVTSMVPLDAVIPGHGIELQMLKSFVQPSLVESLTKLSTSVFSITCEGKLRKRLPISLPGMKVTNSDPTNKNNFLDQG
jgi:hypothetical protein